MCEPQVGDVGPEGIAVVEVHRPEAEAREGHREVSDVREGAVHEAGVRRDAGSNPGPALRDGGHLSANGGFHHEVPRVPSSPRVHVAGA